MNLPAVKQITRAMGAEEAERRLGVGRRSLRLAREREVFPASWYPQIRDFCEERGLNCPMDAFNWKSPSENTGQEAP